MRAADYNKIPFALFQHMPAGHISAQKIVASGKGLAAARKAAGKEHKGQLSGAHKLYSGQTVAGGEEYNAVRTVTQRGVYCVQLVFGLFAAVEKKSGAAVFLADGFYSAVKAAVYRVADIGDNNAYAVGFSCAQSACGDVLLIPHFRCGAPDESLCFLGYIGLIAQRTGDGIGGKARCLCNIVYGDVVHTELLFGCA